jgi:hypothetical protein
MVERGHYAFLEKAYRCDQFFAGNQWAESDLNLLKAQKRPALTINKIISTIGTIMGEQIFNRNEVLFRPTNGAAPATADALNKVWMQISQNNQLPWVRSDVFADGIIRSRGFYDVRLNFDDQMQGEVDISQLNSKNVIVDPDAEEYDPDFWNDVIISKWLTPMDIGILYTEEAAKHFMTIAESSFPYAYDSIERVRDRFAGTSLAGAYYGISDNSHVRRNVRVLERQYRKLDQQKHFVDIQSGDMRPIPDEWNREKIALVMQKAQGKINVIKKQVKRIRWTVTADNYVLHDDWSPYKHFTVVPYFPHFRYGTTLGIVEHLLSPQEILNKVSSQELHIVNTTANSGWKIKTGALKNMSIEDLEQSGAQSGLVLELDDPENAQKIQPNQTPQGLDRISGKAEDHIKSISNVSDSMQGFDREDVAAKAIQYKTQRGSINLTKVMDNLERTDWILARNVLDLIQGYYTEERIIDITHDDVTRAAESITVNQPNPDEDAEDEIINDLTLGEYSITITSTPFRATMEDSQFEQARALKEIGVNIPDSVLIENSRLQRKSEILKQMQGDKDSPEAKAQAALQQRQAEATVGKLEAEVGDKQADTQLKMSKAKKADTEAQDDPAMQAQQQAAVEEQKAVREHELATAKMQNEFVLSKQKLEAELQMKREAQAEEFRLKSAAAEQDAQIRRESAAHERTLQRAAEAAKPPADTDD